ncbi:MAG: DUF4440 domain-containing protein [Gemmatimonadetes bacterium]|nr:DUF4440 domain-containing protein [Gemmatimonadota bacterium]NIX40186.1 DUF4440 domain-containing protein [Gemmatimonadota bacterium]
MTRPDLHPSLVLGIILIFASIPAAGAQTLPGIPGSQGGTAAMHMAEYYADVMSHVSETMSEWRSAWRVDDLEALSGIYMDGALLLFPDEEPTWGREAIRTVLGARIGDLGEGQLSLGDVHASGKLAYVGGRFFFEVQSGDRAGQRISGYHVTIFFRQEGVWMIRSQVFRPNFRD